LGLRRAGFSTLHAFDSDAAACETYRDNLGDHVEIADARSVEGSRLAAHLGLRRGELDLLAGGPPCQGFSKQKRGAHLGDPRNALVLEFLRLVQEMAPRSFLLENVAQLAQVRGRDFVGKFRELPDYRLKGHFYVAADYGVAQTRERYVLIGLRDDVVGDFVVPPPTTPDWPTIFDAIGDLPSPPEDGSDHAAHPNHRRTRPSAVNIERFSYVPPGGGWQDIPFDLRLPCHQVVDVSRGGWPDVYGRLRWDGQAPTITGGFDSFSRGRYGHPAEDRALTPREAARLQGFPDTFIFKGTRHQIRHQICNAVPVPLAAAIGDGIADALAGRSRRTGQLALNLA
jgi:DNA (cytosine-5)-methyltransferase 1